MKINIESSLPEIWIRNRFLEINGSPSLFRTVQFTDTYDYSDANNLYQIKKFLCKINKVNDCCIVHCYPVHRVTFKVITFF